MKKLNILLICLGMLSFNVMADSATFTGSTSTSQDQTNYLQWAIDTSQPASTIQNILKKYPQLLINGTCTNMDVCPWATGVGYTPFLNAVSMSGMSGSKGQNAADTISVLLDFPGINVNATDWDGHSFYFNAVQTLTDAAVWTKLLNMPGVNKATMTDVQSALYFKNTVAYNAIINKWPSIAQKKGNVAEFQQAVAQFNTQEMQSNLGISVNLNALLPASAVSDLMTPTLYSQLGSMTPLMIASYYGQLPMVQWLLAIKKNPLVTPTTVDVDTTNSIGDTALIIAAKTNRSTVVQALIKAGANVNAENKTGDTALTYAVNLPNDVGATSATDLINAGATASSGAALQFILSKLTASNPANKQQLINTLMEKNPAVFFNNVLEMGSLEYINDILAGYKTKVNINTPTQFNNKNNVTALSKPVTPLMYAIIMYSSTNAYGSIITSLLNNGANPNTVGAVGATAYTPVQYAAARGLPSVVKSLLAKGATPNTTVSQGGPTALMYAASSGDLATVNILLETKGVNINATAFLQKTALIYAVEPNSGPVITALLAKGANLNAQDINGDTALMVALNLDGTTGASGVKISTANVIAALAAASTQADLITMNPLTGYTAASLAKQKNITLKPGKTAS